VTELRARGVREFGAVADAGDAVGLASFIADTAGILGGLDVCVPNASCVFGGGNDEDSWRKGVETCVLGTMHGREGGAAVPRELRRRGQEWWERASTLGDLLYSVPLAPCEQVKLALLDWRRRDFAVQ
jgi:hypothetical protein